MRVLLKNRMPVVGKEINFLFVFLRKKHSSVNWLHDERISLLKKKAQFLILGQSLIRRCVVTD